MRRGPEVSLIRLVRRRPDRARTRTGDLGLHRRQLGDRLDECSDDIGSRLQPLQLAFDPA
jgi:hypothetical protein